MINLWNKNIKLDLSIIIKGSSINDVTVLGGRGSRILWRQYQGLCNKKSDDLGRRVENCLNLCDVIYGRPLRPCELFLVLFLTSFSQVFGNQNCPFLAIIPGVLNLFCSQPLKLILKILQPSLCKNTTWKGFILVLFDHINLKHFKISKFGDPFWEFGDPQNGHDP